MKVDLFGGTGFIGSAFNRRYQRDTFVHPRDYDFPVSTDVLYMISTTDNYSVFTDPHKDIQVNLVKLMNVLSNCKEKDITFNFVSSWFVYGKTKDLPASESSICDPRGFYSITKKCAEDLIISYCTTFNIKYRILRLCNVYGPGDKGISKKKNALQFIINQLKANEPVSLYDNGEVVRDYMHVNDVVDAIYLAMNRGQINSIINIGSGVPTKFKDVIDIAIKKTGSTSQILNIPTPDFHKIVQIKDMYLNTDTLKSLGFVQSMDLNKGIETIL